MKLKLAFLLALISSAGLIAADAPKGDAPKGDAPKKAEKGAKKGPQKPDAVSDDDWKKFLAASEKAREDAGVKAAEAKLKEEKSPDNMKALQEARKAAILKADASLESVLKAIEDSRAKAKGGKKKKDEAAK
jgi:hypothetical protein